MAQIKVDGELIEVPDHFTLLQAAEAAGREIPRFCFHERLSIAGNCRMCLVEIKGGPPKPQASCAMGVKDLRPGPNGEPPEMFTNTPMVKKAREGVLEFLLINHPLDCPICDQGGECDLQDQAMAYGLDGSRFSENKRIVNNKYLGPLIKTEMTRCIHCTRCVRFITEIAGVSELGLLGRGEDAQITPYLERALSSEMQGNLVDLCPVGALTSKPYAFTARPWELEKTDSIDVMDALGSAIRIDSRGREVMRIVPRINEDINEEWIADKTRFIWDGLKTQRLDRPYIKKGKKLVVASWQEALEKLAKALKKAGKNIGAIAGDLSGVEEIYALKLLLEGLGSKNMDCRPINSALDSSLDRGAYIFNPKISGLEEADAILIIGANPRIEATVLNARISRLSRNKDLPIGLVGEKVDLTYDYRHLGDDVETVKMLAAGAHKFNKILKKAKKPIIIVGESAIAHPNESKKLGRDILAMSLMTANNSGALNDDWNGFALLHNAASRVGGLDIGFVPQKGGACSGDMLKMAQKGELDILFLLGADEFDLQNVSDDTLIVYIGSHGDRGAHSADIILPGAAYSEKSSIYVNSEGRVQMGYRAIFPPGEAKEDWAIIRAISGRLGDPLPFDNLTQLRQKLFEDYPHLKNIDKIKKGNVSALKKLAKIPAQTKNVKLKSMIKNYYLTNPIARSSKIMAQCSKAQQEIKQAEDKQ